MKPVCPICQSRGKRFLAVDFGLEIFACPVCTLQFLWPIPSPAVIRKLYSKKYFYHEGFSESGYNDYKALLSSLTLEAQKKLTIVSQFVKSGKLLDLGAGTGIFLSAAKKSGFQVSGNDISHSVANSLKKITGNVYIGPVANNLMPRNSFEVVTAWDVIEHFPDPAALSVIADSLKKGGYLFLTTPDTQSWDARVFGKKWYGYTKIPEHILYFNRRSLTRVLTNYGLVPVLFKPWGFVRNLDFLAGKTELIFPGWYRKIPSSWRRWLAKLTIEVNMTDFLVVAKKE